MKTPTYQLNKLPPIIKIPKICYFFSQRHGHNRPKTKQTSPSNCMGPAFKYNKLYLIKLLLAPKLISFFCLKREQAIQSRVRIDRTNSIHVHLIENNQDPRVNFAILYILIIIFYHNAHTLLKNDAYFHILQTLKIF